MPRWGASNWLNNPPIFPPVAGSPNPPFGILRMPAPNATQVPEDTIIRVGLYDLDGDLETTFTQVYLDNVLVYDAGSNTFTDGYRGQMRLVAGRQVVEFSADEVFDWASVHTVSVNARDYMGNLYDGAWQFTVRINPDCYSGNGLIDLESLVLSPMQRFLDIEPLRLLLLQQALVDTESVDLNRDNLAARALYQMAYDTEISGVLNAYATRNDIALKSVLCNKRKTLDIAKVLDANKVLVDRAIDALFSQGALPREYRNNFVDYMDSMLFSYRVSAACTTVFLARAVEHAAGL